MIDEVSGASPPGASAVAEKRQPRGLYLLFGVEMWERFSYYGMRAFLVLFLTSTAGGWGWSKKDASLLYAWYTGLVYLTPLIGGILADRVLGLHRAIIIGSVIIAAGHFVLAIPTQSTFYVGLALIVIGTGFHKSNISTMVGHLYARGDGRRDAGFTIFYMGINTGAVVGPLICGGLARSPRFGWHWGFGAAGVGMVLGLVSYVALKRRFLGTLGDSPAARSQPTKETRTEQALSPEEWRRVAAIGILAFFVILFWIPFEQAGSSMSFFAEERTNRHLFGFEFPAPWFQSINPAVIILFAPVFAGLWTRLAVRNREPATPVKMAVALVLIGVSFVLMTVAAHRSDGGALVSPLWLAGAYLLQSFGELCLSPVGLSMVSKLAPVKFASLMMGVWFVANFFSGLLSGLLAGTIERVEKGEIFHVLGGQADFFLIFVISSFAAALLLFLLSPKVKRLMEGRA